MKIEMNLDITENQIKLIKKLVKKGLDSKEIEEELSNKMYISSYHWEDVMFFISKEWRNKYYRDQAKMARKQLENEKQ